MEKIVLIGAGNVATHLGMALQKSGHDVMQVYSRTEESARALADKLGCRFTTSIAEVLPDATLYIVSVKDDALASLLPQLTARNADALFVHTAGSVSIDVWSGLTRRYGVLYPMQTFSKTREVDFSTVSFFVEASCPEDVDLLIALASGFGSKVYQATSAQRKYLHIAAVFSCNFANHMYAVAAHLLAEHGLPFDAMLPLIDETARKVHLLPPVEAQTGPAVRNDKAIMDSHLAMLSAEQKLAELYRLISRDIHSFDKK